MCDPEKGPRQASNARLGLSQDPYDQAKACTGEADTEIWISARWIKLATYSMKALVPELPERIACTKEYFVNRKIPRKGSLESGKAGRRSRNGLGAIHSPAIDDL